MQHYGIHFLFMYNTLLYFVQNYKIAIKLQYLFIVLLHDVFFVYQCLLPKNMYRNIMMKL
jgi:hypothetical protein